MRGDFLALINIGVPMIFPALPVMLVSLLPIIFIEAVVLRHFLTISPSKSIEAAGFANLASTFVGIPLTWFFLAALQMLTGGDRNYGLHTPLERFLAVTWQAPWLNPYDRELHWMIPTAGLVLLVPFFFASWFVETFVVEHVLKDAEAIKTKRAVMYANLVSYAFLAIYLVIVLVTSKPPDMEPLPI